MEPPPLTSTATTSKSASSARGVAPMTGKEFLDSLRDDREVYIYGERVRDIVEHPAFRNTARMLARLYDALHDRRRSQY